MIPHITEKSRNKPGTVRVGAISKAQKYEKDFKVSITFFYSTRMSERTLGSEDNVLKPFPSLVLEDNLSVSDNTMFVNSPIWQRMSENLRSILFFFEITVSIQ